MDVTARILELMEKRGWTAYRLAKEADIAQTTLNNLFHRVNAPTIYTLESVCKGFGITLSEFFREDGESTDLLTQEQKRLLENWDKLSDGGREGLLRLLEDLNRRAEEKGSDPK